MWSWILNLHFLLYVLIGVLRTVMKLRPLPNLIFSECNLDAGQMLKYGSFGLLLTLMHSWLYYSCKKKLQGAYFKKFSYAFPFYHLCRTIWVKTPDKPYTGISTMLIFSYLLLWLEYYGCFSQFALCIIVVFPYAALMRVKCWNMGQNLLHFSNASDTCISFTTYMYWLEY